MKKLTRLIQFLIVFAYVFALVAGAAKTYAASSISINTVIQATNTYRNSLDIHPLSTSGRLSRSAQQKAQDMCNDDYWAHTAPDGKTGWDFMDENGYNYQAAGENLAKGFTDSNSIVTAWEKSPKHNENLLSEDFTETGVGIVFCENEHESSYIVVALYAREFGKSLPTEPTAEKTPKREEVTPPQLATKQLEQKPTPLQVKKTTPRMPMLPVEEVKLFTPEPVDSKPLLPAESIVLFTSVALLPFFRKM